ncbi:hypothetical protein CL617_02280 [archaeon]|jgi:hypothetical protein|nr:hypothetical protein [archaeon]|tara:strand:+ start:1359 stop:1760 length:402 start_codon:yes stop_codon:yes gene_type:complete
MRDDIWLKKRMDNIWELLFPEISRLNNVNIRFKGKWKNKFGHIMKKTKDTEIVINGLFKELKVPEYIIDITIAHELVHYAHGFNSPLPRLHKHPHKGGVVTKELTKRGFGHLLRKEKVFTKKEWLGMYKSLKP